MVINPKAQILQLGTHPWVVGCNHKSANLSATCSAALGPYQIPIYNIVLWWTRFHPSKSKKTVYMRFVEFRFGQNRNTDGQHAHMISKACLWWDVWYLFSPTNPDRSPALTSTIVKHETFFKPSLMVHSRCDLMVHNGQWLIHGWWLV